MRTPRGRKSPPPLRTPLLRIAGNAGTYTLRNADLIRSGGRCSGLIADTAAPHCRQRRYLRTPQRGLPGVQDGPTRLRRTAVTHCGHPHSTLQTPKVPTHSTMQTCWQVGEAWTHCGHPADERARQHCGLRVSALQTMQAPSYSAMQVCWGCAVSMLLALRECVAT